MSHSFRFVWSSFVFTVVISAGHGRVIWVKVINISKEATSVNQISKSILQCRVVKRRTGSDSEIGNTRVNRPTKRVCEAEVFI